MIDLEDFSSDSSEEIKVIDNYVSEYDSFQNAVIKQHGVFVVDNDLTFKDSLLNYGIGVDV